MNRGQELAWAAGFFEGEGCITLDRRWGGHWRLKLTSTDRDMLERFVEITQPRCTTLYAKQRRSAGHKQAWEWSSHRRADVDRIVRLLLPYLGERRADKANEVLDHHATLGGTRVTR